MDPQIISILISLGTFILGILAGILIAKWFYHRQKKDAAEQNESLFQKIIQELTTFFKKELSGVQEDVIKKLDTLLPKEPAFEEKKRNFSIYVGEITGSTVEKFEKASKRATALFIGGGVPEVTDDVKAIFINQDVEKDLDT